MGRFLLSLTLAGLLCSASTFAAPAAGEDHREAWLELIDTLEQIDPRPASLPGHRFEAARQAMARLEGDELNVLASSSASPELIRGLSQMLSPTPMPGNRLQEIDQPDPEVEPAACKNITAARAAGLLATMEVADGVLAGAKWLCHETAGGFNDAFACISLELTAAAAKAAFEYAEFCLNEKKRAHGEATLDTIRNIADFLDEDLTDNVELRSTQTSVDAVQDSVDTANAGIDEANDRLEDVQGDLPVLQSSADQALSDLDALATRLNGAVTQLQDIQFRLRTTQAVLDDTDERTADTDLTAAEIRRDTQALIGSISSLLEQIGQNYEALRGAQQNVSRDRIAASLAVVGGGVLRYRFPRSQGGQLEEVREVVVQAVSLMEQAGADTSGSLVLVANGNVAFGNGAYLDAYEAYAQAYRQLLEASP